MRPFTAVLREAVQQQDRLTFIGSGPDSLKNKITPYGVLEVDLSIFCRHGSRLRPFLV